MVHTASIHFVSHSLVRLLGPLYEAISVKSFLQSAHLPRPEENRKNMRKCPAASLLHRWRGIQRKRRDEGATAPSMATKTLLKINSFSWRNNSK